MLNSGEERENFAWRMVPAYKWDAMTSRKEEKTESTSSSERQKATWMPHCIAYHQEEKTQCNILLVNIKREAQRRRTKKCTQNKECPMRMSITKPTKAPSTNPTANSSQSQVDDTKEENNLRNCYSNVRSDDRSALNKRSLSKSTENVFAFFYMHFCDHLSLSSRCSRAMVGQRDVKNNLNNNRRKGEREKKAKLKNENEGILKNFISFRSSMSVVAVLPLRFCILSLHLLHRHKQKHKQKTYNKKLFSTPCKRSHIKMSKIILSSLFSIFSLRSAHFHRWILTWKTSMTMHQHLNPTP